ncbi:MAG: DUF1549 domain-containing protein [Pirellulaceae bacterium]
MNTTFRYQWLAACVAVWMFAAPWLAQAADAPNPIETARRIDQLLAKEVGVGESAAGRCADEIYLRRVYLDLVGQTPSVEDILIFTLDPDPNKRQAVVERLLEDGDYGRNWARYWRDVVFSRRTEDRAFLAAPATTEWLTEQFNSHVSWDQIATELITAEGDVREVGSTGLIMAQAGMPEDTVSEISRIFLGIQIQCAQCHDHPTDQWKRQQFHELAAFFPRVAVRPKNEGEQRSFEVYATDFAPRFRRPAGNNRFRGTLEHRMPDLNDPTSAGEVIRPVFFVSGERLEFGTPDADRRGTLAKWLTSADNPWFAKAYVNRIWAELVGEGFYEPVDDIGPERECTAPDTMDALAAAFTDSGYDCQWLFQTIMATEAYQRESRSRRSPTETPFQANVAQRLRADQLFDALVNALELPRGLIDGAGARVGGPGGAYGVRAGARQVFSQAFGYDPSERREEISGTVQQTLAVMNSPFINGAINAGVTTSLGRLISQQDDDRTIVIELYLRTLSRQPSDDELATCVEYVRQGDDRREAFEDVLWSLINSTEFLHRR